MTDRTRIVPHAPPDRPAEPHARLRSLAPIVDALDGLGVDAEPLLERIGVRVRSFRDSAATISMHQLDELLGACVQRTRCAHFGLLAGACLRLEHLGEIGRVAASDGTVGEALRDLTLSSELHNEFGAPALAVHRAGAILTYGLHDPDLKNADVAYDVVVAAINGVMRELCGDEWRPEAVHLPRVRPRNVKPYRDLFGAPLRFGAMQAGVVFQAATLSRPVTTADPAERRRLREHVRCGLQLEPPVVRDVRRAIRVLLERGHCSRAGVAAHLSMHERALGRRLLRAETTFQALLDDTRADLAQEMLRATDASVQRIARTVGYRDSTVLGRAFRRWTGMTPGQYRADHRKPGGGAGRADAPRN